MTNEEADELLSNNDWAKWSDARELLQEAFRMGVMQEREQIAARPQAQPLTVESFDAAHARLLHEGYAGRGMAWAIKEWVERGHGIGTEK